MEPQPFVFDNDGETKRHAPATLRNRGAIADVLREVLPSSGFVVEVASGTGEHVVHLARLFPGLTWQPSDFDALALASIEAWKGEASLPNILEPIVLDVCKRWPVENADAIVCINLVHISAWEATLGLLRGASQILPKNGPLFLYGPFRREGQSASQSNEDFDVSLRARNPDWGLRYVEDVIAAARICGLEHESTIEMPAHNLSLLFRA
ncbi:MAG: DUF938 domain-containing protein [Sphingorhabdus sp.]